MGLSSASGRLSSRTVLLAAVFLTCLGAAWRFSNLGGDSYWLDEMTTVRGAHAGLSAMYNHLDHPPLVHVVTYYIIKLFGDTEYAVRFPMAVSGVLAIPLMVLLGVVLRRPGAGLWSALMLAVLPFHLRYSQEARMYAFLMTFSLASYVLLVQAMARPRLGWWAAFGIVTALNLYTHYAALVVLGWESILIAIWLVSQLLHRRVKMIFGPIVAALIVVGLYAPWLPWLLIGVESNTGSQALGAYVNSVPPIAVWVSEAYWGFGYGFGLFPLVVAGLFAIGLMVLYRERDWTGLSLIALGISAPLVYINAFGVARPPLLKYIIYLLPLYLLSAGVAVDFLVRLMRQKLGSRSLPAAAGASALLGLALILVTWPLLRQEHAYVEEDWKGITQYLARAAKEGDVFVSMALDLPNGYNQGGVVWPYYLSKTFPNYFFIATNQIMPTDVRKLADMHHDVWMVLLDRVTPVAFQEGTAQVIPFQNSHYLVHPSSKRGSDLDQMIAMYQQMIPMAAAPSPQCMLRQDLAAMYVAASDFISAQRMAAEAGTQCPSGQLADGVRYPLLSQIYQGLLAQYRQSEQTDKLRETQEAARNVAAKLLQLGMRDPFSMDVLTVEDLIGLFRSGKAQASEANSPAPVQVVRATMPQDGDWSDALFIHSGASVSFRITLPQQPVALSFRAAMDPKSWGWGGDGSTFVVSVDTDAAGPKELFRKYIGNDVADRRWHDESVGLGDYAGQTITLTLASEPGPKQDYTGDLVDWGEPRVILAPKCPGC